MKALFEILPEDFDPQNCTLSCESTGKSFSYAVKNADDVIISAGVYHFDKNHPDPGNPIALKILFHHHPVLSERFAHTCVIYSVAESVLIPSVLYNSKKNDQVLKLIHGDVNAGTVTLHDHLRELDTYNIYRVNSSIYDILKSAFSPATHLHQYSLFLKRMKNTTTDCLHIVFYTYKMVVVLYQNGLCKLINTFNYKAPEDVSYILLNITSNLDARNIPVQISGMIEENSALFKEIFKYFEKVTLANYFKDYKTGDEFLKYPPHFFTHIFAFDVCEL